MVYARFTVGRPFSHTAIVIRHRLCPTPPREQPSRHSSTSNAGPITNPLNIQLLSPAIHRNVFPKSPLPANTSTSNSHAMKIAHMHLKNWNLDINQSSQLPDLDLPLPPLLGSSIADHFNNIGDLYSRPILDKIESVIRTPHSEKPRIPSPNEWKPIAGWVRYPSTYGDEPTPVPYPDGPVLVFDVEVCPKLSNYPVMAVAQSSSAWYAWTSPWLFRAFHNSLVPGEVPSDLIILGPHAKIVIGHNVGYDRARVGDEYTIKNPNRVWLDTLSMHVAVNGMSTQQRPVYMNSQAKTDNTPDKPASYSQKYRRKMENEKWLAHACSNSLKSCAKFYLDTEVSKDIRDCFVKAESADLIVDHFYELMDYCATDVDITSRLFSTVFPLFQAKCPHPVSFLGQAAMGSCFLPVSCEWNQFWQTCDAQVDEMHEQIEQALISLAYYTVDLGFDRSKSTTVDGSIPEADGHEFPLSQYLPDGLSLRHDLIKADPWLSQLDWDWKPLRFTKNGDPYKSQVLPNYPNWFRDLWDPKNKTISVSQRKRVAPFLLQLRWAGHPVAYLNDEKWCYMVAPELLDKHVETSRNVTNRLGPKDSPNLEAWRDLGYKFYKLPHVSGDASNTGNPFAKAFACYFEDGTLTSDHPQARQALDLQMQASYWISAGERIRSQFVVWDKSKSPSSNNALVTGAGADPPKKGDSESLGMILPQMQVMGTITRRAVEKTWLTASNSKKGRIGSDVKRYIVAPPGYAIVGADVDSEELWIASVMGDAQFGQHGASALGWMTLQGTKTHGTDLHSVTASILGISRDQAKVFNYARIYGAGEKFATTTLFQHNRNLSPDDAGVKAKSLYEKTKGVKQKTQLKGITPGFEYWVGGRESYMFNAIESIAHSSNPRTPVLNCQIPNSLMVQNCGGNYITSRINWVVQSSGVDYLHLLIVSMQYLIDTYEIDARLLITIHDEIRYLVSESDKYRAAMALQISNLWTRAMFVHQLGFTDLPQSVAFFSAVDIDHCLRKEVSDPCITPNNSTPVPSGETLDIYQLNAKGEAADFLKTRVGSALESSPKPALGNKQVRDFGTTQHLNWLLLQSMPSVAKFCDEQNKSLRECELHVAMGNTHGHVVEKKPVARPNRLMANNTMCAHDGFSEL